MADIFNVIWGKRVTKQLERLPLAIELKFHAWVGLIKLVGLRSVRRSYGLHDEPLQGVRFGQRSVRLNKSYRAIYVEHKGTNVELIEVIEVNKHDY